MMCSHACYLGMSQALFNVFPPLDLLSYMGVQENSCVQTINLTINGIGVSGSGGVRVSQAGLMSSTALISQV